MPSPMSGRGKSFLGYEVTDTHLLVGALVIFLGATAYARRPGSATTTVLRDNAARVRLREREATALRKRQTQRQTGAGKGGGNGREN